MTRYNFNCNALIRLQMREKLLKEERWSLVDALAAKWARVKKWGKRWTFRPSTRF